MRVVALNAWRWLEIPVWRIYAGALGWRGHGVDWEQNAERDSGNDGDIKGVTGVRS